MSKLSRTVAAVFFACLAAGAVFFMYESDADYIPDLIHVENKYVIPAFVDTSNPGHSIKGMKMICQLPELPTGCEVTSLTMVLNYWGYELDKFKIAREYLNKRAIEHDDNIDKLYGPDFLTTFVGDPESDKESFGCFAPCITDAAQRYIDDQDEAFTAHDITGTEFYNLFEYISNDIPVIIWITMKLVEPEYVVTWETFEDNREVTWPTNEHCVVLSGFSYTDNTVRLHDPVNGVVNLNMEDVKKRYDQMGAYAVIIEENK